jgi:hypothetical protein
MVASNGIAMLPVLLLTLGLAQPPTLSEGVPPAPPQSKAAVPRLSIEPAGRVNLGSAGPTEVRAQVYLLKNTSDRQLSLRVLDLSPGVTVEGPALKGPIAPGGSAQLTLRVDPSEFVGWQVRNVKLGTDDPGQGNYFLPVGMTVRPDLTVDTLKKSFGEVAIHETPQLGFLFRRETGQATRLWISSPLPPYLDAEIEPVPGQLEPPGTSPLAPSDPRGTAGAVRLTLRPSKVEPGRMAGLESITVESTSPHQPRFQLYLDWQLKLPVLLSKPRIVFLSPDEWAQPLFLKSRDGKQLRLTKTWLEGAGFTLAEPPSGPAAQLELSIQRVATGSATAVLNLRLQDEPTLIRVPLSYLPPDEGKPASANVPGTKPVEPNPHPHRH